MTTADITGWDHDGLTEPGYWRWVAFDWSLSSAAQQLSGALRFRLVRSVGSAAIAAQMPTVRIADFPDVVEGRSTTIMLRCTDVDGNRESLAIRE